MQRRGEGREERPGHCCSDPGRGMQTRTIASSAVATSASTTSATSKTARTSITSTASTLLPIPPLLAHLLGEVAEAAEPPLGAEAEDFQAAGDLGGAEEAVHRLPETATGSFMLSS